MKCRKLLLSIGIVVLLLNSCELFEDNPEYEGPGGGRENDKFYAQNAQTGRYYSLYADLIYNGDYCQIWVEQESLGTHISEAQAITVGQNFDNTIYNYMIGAFGNEFDINGKTMNTLQVAHYYCGNETEKLFILLLDIQDGYHPGGSYVAGYFTSYDFNKNTEGNSYTYYSNERPMIYIDVYPLLGAQGLNGLYSTLSHEMQHLMNFTTTLETRRNGNNLNYMDIWIDEGLSGAAQWLCGTYYNHPYTERVSWYNSNGNGNGLIDKGNNFYVWGNRADEYVDAVLDDYATTYLFFQWLRLQSSIDEEIYRKIISSPHSDFTAVTDAAGESIDEMYKGNDGWHSLLRDWMAANYINSSDTSGANSRYGYKNEFVDQYSLRTHTAPAKTTSILLAPGEGVYSNINSSYSIPVPDEKKPNIRYAHLGKNSNPAESGEYTGGALLTYNINTVKHNNSNGTERGDPEEGQTTGVAANIEVYANAPVQNLSQDGPYAISVADMLRRNGHKENSFNFKNSVLRGIDNSDTE